MADSDTTPPPAETVGQLRGGEGSRPLTEDAIRQLIREEVATAVATALARPTHGPGTSMLNICMPLFYFALALGVLMQLAWEHKVRYCKLARTPHFQG